MPASVVKSKKDETMWRQAKRYVAKSKGKSVSNLKGIDWGLVMNIFKSMKEKYSDKKLPKKYSRGAKKESMFNNFERSVLESSVELTFGKGVSLVEAKSLKSDPTDKFISDLISSARAVGADIEGEFEMTGQKVSDKAINDEAANIAIEQLSGSNKEFNELIKDKKVYKSIKSKVIKGL